MGLFTTFSDKLAKIAEKSDTSEYYEKTKNQTEEQAYQKQTGLITDPFYKDNLKSMFFWYNKEIFEDYYVWTGKIEVLKGNTSAEIKTKKHATLPSLLEEVEAILKSLK